MNADKALDLFIRRCKRAHVKRVLDIGAGAQKHTKQMREQGLTVVTNDYGENNRVVNLRPDYSGDYLTLTDIGTFDGIWCSHTLEHQRNVGLFLDKLHRDLEEGGVLGITVPPRKDKIVGGHLSLWNVGLLLYNLVLAKFDCSGAGVATYGYNCSVVLNKKTANLPDLTYSGGDIERLKTFFPKGLDIKQGFNGRIEEHNWK